MQAEKLGPRSPGLGGTLIDGNGGIPVKDAVVVIEGNKITKVSQKGQAAYPANAWEIKADGKYVLPGLFDSRNSYSWAAAKVTGNCRSLGPKHRAS